LLAEHKVLTGPAATADAVAAAVPVVRDRRAGAQAHLLVRDRRTAGANGRNAPPPGWEAHRVDLEELVLGYLRAPAAAALPGPGRLATGAVPA
ncbi:MAG TPA: hypothetical protein VF069_00940, partial [Streptosporangiaceae bacterium]